MYFSFEEFVLCEDNLPFLLIPNSLYSDTFLLNGQSQINFEMENSGTYEINVMINGCVFEKDFQLEIKNCETAIFFPNIFSPNNDNINDFFFPQGDNFELINLQIFNRWGGQIFQTNDANVKWSGEDQPQGVYIFKAPFFNALSNQNEEILGDVLLIR